MSQQTARAVIFNSHHQLLMIERHKAEQHYFVLPGGHVGEGESPEQAVVREVAEETGLIAHVKCLLYTGADAFGQEQLIFLCTSSDNPPNLRVDSIESRAQQTGEQRWQPGWYGLSQLNDEVVYPLGLFHYLRKDEAAHYRYNPYPISNRPL